MPTDDDSSGNPIVAPATTAMTAVVNKAIAVADNSPDLKAAGNSLVRSGRTIAQTVEVCLLPLAAVNFAYDKARRYFIDKFPEKIEKHTDHIPPENVQDPKPMVAAEALKGLSFSHDEPSLEDMYINLLATAMDSRKHESSAHPAFVEVIKQLTGEEAHLLKSIFLQRDSLAVVRLHHLLRSGDEFQPTHRVLCRYAFPIHINKVPFEIPGIGAMVDNWIRLGLVSVDFMSSFSAEGRYDFADARPETLRARALIGDGESIDIVPGIFAATEFGKRFAASVGITE